MTFHEVHDFEQSVAGCQLYLNDCIFVRHLVTNSFIIMSSRQKGLFERKFEQFCCVIRLEGAMQRTSGFDSIFENF